MQPQYVAGYPNNQYQPPMGTCAAPLCQVCCPVTGSFADCSCQVRPCTANLGLWLPRTALATQPSYSVMGGVIQG